MDNLDITEIKLQIGLWASLVISTIFLTQSLFAKGNLFTLIFLISMSFVWLMLAIFIWFDLNKIEDIKFLAILRAYNSYSLKEKSKKGKR